MLNGISPENIEAEPKRRCIIPFFFRRYCIVANSQPTF